MPPTPSVHPKSALDCTRGSTYPQGTGNPSCGSTSPSLQLQSEALPFLVPELEPLLTASHVKGLPGTSLLKTVITGYVHCTSLCSVKPQDHRPSLAQAWATDQTSSSKQSMWTVWYLRSSCAEATPTQVPWTEGEG